MARRAHGTVGRAGRAGVHRRRRASARASTGTASGPCAGTRPRTAWWRARPRPASSTSPAVDGFGGEARAGADDRGRPSDGGLHLDLRARGDAAGVRRLGGQGALAQSAGDPLAAPRSDELGRRSRSTATPARTCHGAAAGGRGRQGAHVLDGRRHGDRAAQPSRPAAVQPSSSSGSPR